MGGGPKENVYNVPRLVGRARDVAAPFPRSGEVSRTPRVEDPHLWAPAHSDGNPQEPENRHPSTRIRAELRNVAEKVHEKVEKKAI